MNNQQVVENFVAEFNRMCRETGRDYLLREKGATGESGAVIKRYKVEYKLKTTSYGWEIFGESRRFFFFKNEFPLLTIMTRGDNKLGFLGLFTEKMPRIEPNNPAELHQILQNYLNNCRNMPETAFVNV
jgi:hypothetical protein